MTDKSQYVVIRLDGKQYRCSTGDTFIVSKLDASPGESLTVSDVLLVKDGDAVKVGSPTVSGSKVTLKVLGHSQDKKVIIFKKRRRKGYTKKQGHRQDRTTVTVENVTL